MKGVLAQFPWFLVLLAVLVSAVIGFRFYGYFIEKDYFIYANVSCDPALEECFIADCSPEEWMGCPDGPYKKVEVLSAYAPKCLEEHTCSSFHCDGLDDCEVTYCADATLEEGESCFIEEEQEAVFWQQDHDSYQEDAIITGEDILLEESE